MTRLVILILLAVVLAACASNQTEPATSSKGTVSYGRTQPVVLCPDGVTRVKKRNQCPVTPPPPPPTQTCPDGSVILATEVCPVVPPPPPPTQVCPDGSVILATEVCPAPPPPPPPPAVVWEDGWLAYPLTEPYHGLNRATYAGALADCPSIYPGPQLVKGLVYKIWGWGASTWTDGVNRDHWSVVPKGLGEGTPANMSTVPEECLIGLHRDTPQLPWTQVR